MAAQAQKRTVFVSYSHRDVQWLERVKVHLQPVVEAGALELWSDHKIEGGDLWRKELDEALAAAKVAVLLVTADFFASKFIQLEELPAILERAHGRGTIILPVIISASRFTREPQLAAFQSINDPSAPLAGLAEPDQEAVLDRLSKRVEELLRPAPTEQPASDAGAADQPFRASTARSAQLPGQVGPTQPEKKPWVKLSVAALALGALSTVAAVSLGPRDGSHSARDEVPAKASASGFGSALPLAPPPNPRGGSSAEGEPKDPKVLFGKRAFTIAGEVIAYASPDTTHDVLQEKLSKAKKSIQIGVYDLSAPHVKRWLSSALGRGVKVSILLGSSQKAMSAELRALGATVFEAPPSSIVFGVYHPKFIIVDGVWSLVQSANLTSNGVPVDKKGNREVGLAVESRELAEYLAGLFQKDAENIGKTQGKEAHLHSSKEPSYEPYDPVERFAALRLGGATQPVGVSGQSSKAEPLRIAPVLTPENYLKTLVELLESARESIDVYQPYVRFGRGKGVDQLFEAMKSARARNPNLRVRLILASAPNHDEVLRRLHQPEFSQFVSARVLNPRSGLNNNAKLILVDGRYSVVGSTHWSEAGVSLSREVCLLVDSTAVAGYYDSIFKADWAVAKPAPTPPNSPSDPVQTGRAPGPSGSAPTGSHAVEVGSVAAGKNAKIRVGNVKGPGNPDVGVGSVKVDDDAKVEIGNKE